MDMKEEIQQNALIQIKMERKNISLILKKSPLFKNPIIFMILLDLIGIIITTVETVHIKQNVTDLIEQNAKKKDLYMSYFRMSIILIVLLSIRMIIMVFGECFRQNKYSSRVEVKHNYQVLIFIARFLYTTLAIVPFMMYGYLDNKLQELPFWIPAIVLIAQEVPGFIFVIYLSVCKDREIQRYLKRQEEITKELKLMKNQNNQYEEESQQKCNKTQLKNEQNANNSRDLINRSYSSSISIIELSQGQCLTSSQFLNNTGKLIGNQQIINSLQDDEDQINLNQNLNIRGNDIDQRQGNNHRRNAGLMPSINRGKLNRQESIKAEKLKRKNKLLRTNTHSFKNDNLNYEIEQDTEYFSQNIVQNQIVYNRQNRKSSFQTGRMENSLPFQVPQVSNESTSNIQVQNQQESDFFEQIRDRTRSMPLGRVVDPTNRLRMFMNNNNSQLDSIMEEVYYNNQTLQVPKYGSFNHKRNMPSDQKHQIHPHPFGVNNNQDFNDFDSIYYHESSNNKQRMNLIRSNTQNRKASDLTQNSYGRGSGSTREKSVASSRISESWSPNDKRVVNLNSKLMRNKNPSFRQAAISIIEVAQL
eukprot:403365624